MNKIKLLIKNQIHKRTERPTTHKYLPSPPGGGLLSAGVVEAPLGGGLTEVAEVICVVDVMADVGPVGGFVVEPDTEATK